MNGHNLDPAASNSCADPEQTSSRLNRRKSMNSKLIIGGAALAIIGCAGAVVAQNLHTMHVSLPGGGTETITYVGDTPPKISIAAATPASLAQMSDPFAGDPAFAQMDRMAAEMDARAAAMIRAAEAARFGAPAVQQTGVGALPPGVTGYSMVSTYSGGKACVRTTEYQAAENGAPAKVLTSASQGCGDNAVSGKAAPAQIAAPVTPRPAPVTPVRWDGREAPAQVRD
jgi:hypothetical protein